MNHFTHNFICYLIIQKHKYKENNGSKCDTYKTHIFVRNDLLHYDYIEYIQLVVVSSIVYHYNGYL